MCLTLCKPIDCSLPGFSVCGIFQARVQEWIAISFSRDLPDPGIEPGSPALQADTLPAEPPGKPNMEKTVMLGKIEGKRRRGWQRMRWLDGITDWMDMSYHFHFSLSCTGEGNGNPLQCSCLENPRDGGAWWAAVYGVTQSRTQLK